jgi:beta-glucosidase
VIGADAGAGAQTGGGGSASVVAPYVSRPADAIAQRAGPHVRVAYDDGTNPATAAAAASRADVAIVFGSLAESEGSDLRRIGLSGAQNQLIEAVARVNPRTIVVLNSGSAVAMPWIKGVAGVIEAWYPGQEDGDAIAAVLFGDVDPSGRLPVTFPSSLFQVPASTPTRYPGVAGVQYSEGDLVGYRWYDANDLHPLFPFGFGLSYTSFRLGGLTVPSTTLDGDVDVSATVTNTGRRAGSEVVQLYLGDPPATGEPVRQLKGFAKVALAPGATQTVHMTLDVRALSWWDPAQRRWVASPGRYDVYVGTSSRSLPLRGSFTLAQQIVSGVPTPTAAPSLPGLQPTVADWTACRADFVAPFVGGTSSITGILP